MIYAYDHCHFLFSRFSTPDRCPDCGKENIRSALPEESTEFKSRREVDVAGVPAGLLCKEASTTIQLRGGHTSIVSFYLERTAE